MSSATGASPAARKERSQAETLLYKRLLSGSAGIAQVWFESAVLDKYRGNASYKVIRTNTVGRVRGAQWTLDFGIGGEGDTLIHVPVEALERIPDGERDHWAAHGAALPVSPNYVMMQLTRGACIDDGDTRTW